MNWSDYKKEITSLTKNEKKAIEIMAALDIEYKEELIGKVVDILEYNDCEGDD